MAAQAPPPTQQQQTDTALIAALVVILLSGLTLDSLVRHVAALLIPLGYPVQAIAGAVGLVSADDSFDLPGPDSATNVIRRGEVVRRANYLLAAVRRLAGGGSLADERKFLRLHRGAERARRRAAAEVDRAARQFGPLLGWHALMDDRTTPECKAAHGRNFQATIPPAIGYPGTLHGGNCRCKPGRPFRGAAMLA